MPCKFRRRLILPQTAPAATFRDVLALYHSLPSAPRSPRLFSMSSPLLLSPAHRTSSHPADESAISFFHFHSLASLSILFYPSTPYFPFLSPHFRSSCRRHAMRICMPVFFSFFFSSPTRFSRHRHAARIRTLFRVLSPHSRVAPTLHQLPAVPLRIHTLPQLYPLPHRTYAPPAEPLQLHPHFCAHTANARKITRKRMPDDKNRENFCYSRFFINFAIAKRRTASKRGPIAQLVRAADS